MECAWCGGRVEVTTSRGYRSSRIKHRREKVGARERSVSGLGQEYR